jgi:hypothetical protein
MNLDPVLCKEQSSVAVSPRILLPQQMLGKAARMGTLESIDSNA